MRRRVNMKAAFGDAVWYASIPAEPLSLAAVTSGSLRQQQE